MLQAQQLPSDQVVTDHSTAAQNNQTSLHSAKDNGALHGNTNRTKGDHLVGKKRRHEQRDGEAEPKKEVPLPGATVANGTANGVHVPKKRGRKPGVKNGQKGLNQPSQTQDYQQGPKKRGRKPGTKNKATLEREARMKETTNASQNDKKNQNMVNDIADPNASSFLNKNQSNEIKNKDEDNRCSSPRDNVEAVEQTKPAQ